MNPASIAVGLVGLWLAVQATAGRLPARLLSYRSGTLGVTSAAGAASVPWAQTAVGRAVTWQWPIHGTVTQEYGVNGHPGIDIGAGTGTVIAAAMTGTVTFAGWNNGYGQLVILDHGNGLTSYYAHQSKIRCHVGDRIPGGGVLGEVGSTGHSTGSHLHLEIRVHGQGHNPREFIGGNP